LGRRGFTTYENSTGCHAGKVFPLNPEINQLQSMTHQSWGHYRDAKNQRCFRIQNLDEVSLSTVARFQGFSGCSTQHWGSYRLYRLRFIRFGWQVCLLHYLLANFLRVCSLLRPGGIVLCKWILVGMFLLWNRWRRPAGLWRRTWSVDNLEVLYTFTYSIRTSEGFINWHVCQIMSNCVFFAFISSDETSRKQALGTKMLWLAVHAIGLLAQVSTLVVQRRMQHTFWKPKSVGVHAAFPQAFENACWDTRTSQRSKVKTHPLCPRWFQELMGGSNGGGEYSPTLLKPHQGRKGCGPSSQRTGLLWVCFLHGAFCKHLWLWCFRFQTWRPSILLRDRLPNLWQVGPETLWVFRVKAGAVLRLASQGLTD
jgi:hypothetical protein